MIIIHKLNGEEIVLNANQIELIEEKPDTTITMMNDKKYIVKESIEEILNLVNEYFKDILSTERFQKK